MRTIKEVPMCAYYSWAVRTILRTIRGRLSIVLVYKSRELACIRACCPLFLPGQLCPHEGISRCLVL